MMVVGESAGDSVVSFTGEDSFSSAMIGGWSKGASH